MSSIAPVAARHFLYSAVVKKLRPATLPKAARAMSPTDSVAQRPMGSHAIARCDRYDACASPHVGRESAKRASNSWTSAGKRQVDSHMEPHSHSHSHSHAHPPKPAPFAELLVTPPRRGLPRNVRSAFEADKRYDSALDLLQSPSRWPDVTYPAWKDTAAWVLLRAGDLFDADDAGSLEALTGEPHFKGDELDGLAIVASARLDPKQRTRLLRDWVKRLTDPPAAFFTLYAATFPSDGKVLAWLRPEPGDSCWSERRSRAVLKGLAEAGNPTKVVLAKHLRDPAAKVAERVILVGLLANAAVSLGAPPSAFVCRKGLRRRKCLKTSVGTYRRNKAAVARDLPVCLAALTNWLGP